MTVKSSTSLNDDQQDSVQTQMRAGDCASSSAALRTLLTGRQSGPFLDAIALRCRVNSMVRTRSCNHDMDR